MLILLGSLPRGVRCINSILILLLLHWFKHGVEVMLFGSCIYPLRSIDFQMFKCFNASILLLVNSSHSL